MKKKLFNFYTNIVGTIRLKVHMFNKLLVSVSFSLTMILVATCPIYKLILYQVTCNVGTTQKLQQMSGLPCDINVPVHGIMENLRD